MAEWGFWIWDVCGTEKKNGREQAIIPTVRRNSSVQGEIPGEESDVYAMGKLLEVMLGDEKRETQQTEEKWRIRRISRMATQIQKKRQRRMASGYENLPSSASPMMNASGRVRRQVFKESDFYYVRKLYCP